MLAARGRRYELVVVGGGSLMLLGLLQRPTRDIDVVALAEQGRYVSADPLPKELVQARDDVARTLGLAEDWINPGPAARLDFGLPAGFEARVETKSYGGLSLHIAGRFDQVCLKLYASVDQGPGSKHAQDLRALDPSPEELITAARWTREHDPSEAFQSQLLQALRHFGVEDHDVVL